MSENTSLTINQDTIRNSSFKHRLVVATPATGLVRIEWVDARYHNQVIPTNWGVMDFNYKISPYVPLCYQVADAENMSVRFALEQNAEWLLFLEHDNVIPPATFVMLNEYMVEKKIPVISGLYFTKAVPPEPMVYRGFGKGYYGDWKMGDKIWVKGCPMGTTLIHCSLLRAMWNESPEYSINGQITRRVFHTPNAAWFDPESGQYQTDTGTSDLQWCNRLVEDKIFEKAGWPEIQEMEYPILIDTNIVVKLIDETGKMWPESVPEKFLKTDDAIHVTLNVNTKLGEKIVQRPVKLHYHINGIPAGKGSKEFFKAQKDEILKQIAEQLDAATQAITINDGVVSVDGTV